ncbi:MAG: MTH1187 family thiamine-binding protein [Nitrosopumilus sp.]|nr:MTH1187 family thiamine-binding protein [Nitrosopumilus sp.]
MLKEKRKSLQNDSKLLISNNLTDISLIQAEISIYPMATKTTSASFYIAKAIESIQKIENLRYEINAMGTILESDNIETINSATKQMMETVHNLGIARVEVIIKIDSRRDKHLKMEEKLESIKKQMS